MSKLKLVLEFSTPSFNILLNSVSQKTFIWLSFSQHITPTSSLNATTFFSLRFFIDEIESHNFLIGSFLKNLEKNPEANLVTYLFKWV